MTDKPKLTLSNPKIKLDTGSKLSKNIFMMNGTGEIVFQENISVKKIISVSAKQFPSGVYRLILQGMNGNTKTVGIEVVR